MRCLHDSNNEFKFQPLSTVVILVSHKNYPNRGFLCFGYLLAHKTACYIIDWYKFYIHFRNLVDCHFGMVGVIELKKHGVEVTVNGMTPY
jgi:hypothetical protein